MSAAKPELLHRHGGTILRITHVGHETYKGVADWFFLGDVKWGDGSQSKGTQISPNCVCYSDDAPGSRERVQLAMNAMDVYLREMGEFHDPKHKRDGRVYCWTPNTKYGVKAVEGI